MTDSASRVDARWRRWGLTRMTGREPSQQHRAASPLELFFDLIFVVAVSLSSEQLHDLEVEGHLLSGVIAYLLVFFAVWWAWMNFTWFATAFDTDDWLYRIMTILQMAGALVLAAGAPSAMAYNDFTVVTIGYVIMRIALVAQWLRAAASAPDLRRTAHRYALGITIVQIGWVLRLALPSAFGVAGFLVLAVAEIVVPVVAEKGAPTPWNAHHIAERFSLFTLILLGESVLAATNAVVEAIDEGEHLVPLVSISAAGLVIAAGMWWVYFSREQHAHISTLRSSLTFGYFHYVIFAAAGAFSAGVEVAVSAVGGDFELGLQEATATLTVPVALFLLGIWWLAIRRTLSGVGQSLYLAGVVVVVGATLLAPVVGCAVAALGVALTVIAVEVPRTRSPR